MRKQKWSLPELLLPELREVSSRQNKAEKIYENNKQKIDSRINKTDALIFIDMGIDVTQLGK